MVDSSVQQVEGEDIDSLVKRLETLGALSAKIRCLLLLLKNGVNKSPYHIFTSGSSENMAAVVITESAAAFHSVSAVVRDSSEGIQQMTALLRSPLLLEPLWGTTFRADFVPSWLEAPLISVAAERGVRWRSGVRMEQFCQPPSQAEVQSESRPGITLRPLDASHFDTVKRFWPYAAGAADADVMIRDGLVAGLSIGAFVDGDDGDAVAATSDGLVSWCVMNHNGSLAFMHTLESHRRQGLGSLVLARLTQLCQRRGYPCSASTVLGSEYGTRPLRELGYVSVGEVLVGRGIPPQAS